MTTATLVSLRPRSDGSGDIRRSLRAISSEKEATVSRVDELRVQRRELLATGTTKDILRIDSEIAQLSVWIEQISDLSELIAPTLAPAVAREKLAELVELRNDTLAAFSVSLAWVKDNYAALASKLTEGKRLDDTAQEAAGRFRQRVREAIELRQLDAAGGLPHDFFAEYPASIGLLSQAKLPDPEVILSEDDYVSPPPPTAVLSANSARVRG